MNSKFLRVQCIELVTINDHRTSRHPPYYVHASALILVDFLVFGETVLVASSFSGLRCVSLANGKTMGAVCVFTERFS